MSSDAGVEPEPSNRTAEQVDTVVDAEALRKVYSAGRGPIWKQALPFRIPEPLNGTVALDEVDLSVSPGETLGIIGPNGSGKTTLLRIIAGIAEPTSGTVRTRGSIGSMIELGLGFHPDLTGYENLMTSAVMTGLRRADATAAVDSIVEFAGLRESMDLPLKYFSLGMQARLGFALATSHPVDLLVVDEVLAVGDSEFQVRCIERISEMVANGTALLLVSHEMPLIAGVCSRAVQLREGRIIDQGTANDVVERYLTRSPSRYREANDPAMRILSHRVPNSLGSTDSLRIEMEVEVTRPVHSPSIGVDLGIPTVDPDVTSASSIEAVMGLSAPETYRVVGHAEPLHVSDVKYRVHTCLVDQSTQTVADRAHDDCLLADSSYLGRGHMTFPVRTHLERSEQPEAVHEQHPRKPRAALAPGTDHGVALRVDGLTKRYPKRRARTPLAHALPRYSGATRDQTVSALEDVSFTVLEGEAVGLIGPNGAGKSTLLRAVAGLVDLDRGAIRCEAPAVAILDPGASLREELSGWENVVVVAALLGIGPDELRVRGPSIIEFCGLRDVMDVPVRQYSAGMKARLAMAVALEARGSLLLIDELLAVGDEEFRRRVMDELKQRCRRGASVLFVSHELRLVEQLCERVMHMDGGRIITDGPASTVIDRYGTRSWAAGVKDATSGVRISALEVSQRQLSPGDTLECRGQIAVDRPMPHLRLDLHYRHRPADRSASYSKEMLERVTFLRERMVEPGGPLSDAGRYRFAVEVQDNRFMGDFDLVVTAFDELDNEVAAESWCELRLGDSRPEGYPGPVLDISWHVEPIR